MKKKGFCCGCMDLKFELGSGGVYRGGIGKWKLECYFAKQRVAMQT